MLKPLTAPLALLVVAGAVASSGCSGTSTYGTGTTQEMQLVKDLSGLVSLKRSKPAKIAYEERPGLVRPGQATLPPPVETAATASKDGVSAFPVSPEQQRAQRRAAAARGEKVSGGSAAPTVAGEKLSAEDRKFINWSGPQTPAYRRWLSKRARTMKKNKTPVIAGDAPRKYLTQPPAEYRKAYDSAPKDSVGEAESSKAFKKKSKGNIFSRMLGRG